MGRRHRAAGNAICGIQTTRGMVRRRRGAFAQAGTQSRTFIMTLRTAYFELSWTGLGRGEPGGLRLCSVSM